MTYITYIIIERVEFPFTEGHMNENARVQIAIYSRTHTRLLALAKRFDRPMIQLLDEAIKIMEQQIEEGRYSPT
jgi:hypothetical protein